MKPVPYTLMSGAGNLFVMLDGFAGKAPRDLADLARALCAPVAQGGLEARPDGLIFVGPARHGAGLSMVIHNADGSRPETCGNGLRCAAKLVADRAYVRRDSFDVETDAGVRAVHVEREDGLVVRARVHMGTPRVLALDAGILLGTRELNVAIVEVGNPHCVLSVEDERTAPVAEWGSALERHARFPSGTNVGFLARRSGSLFLRVWERGVGETRACGSGACAAAAVAVERGIARWPVLLHLPGGDLEIDAGEGGVVVLCGPVEERGSGRWTRASAVRPR